MATIKQQISNELFLTIYSDKSFRNAVAGAHKCNDKNSNFLHYATCSYPVSYIVTEEQIEEAKQVKFNDRLVTLSQLGNKLVFVGMGGTYEHRYMGDVCNHRIRTEIINPEGKRFFVEFGSWGESGTTCNHSIDRDLETHYSINYENLSRKMDECIKYSERWNFLSEARREYLKQPFYNFGGLEKSVNKCNPYTKSEILRLVNETFDCHFTEMEIDNFDLTTDCYISSSPKKL